MKGDVELREELHKIREVLWPNYSHRLDQLKDEHDHSIKIEPSPAGRANTEFNCFADAFNVVALPVYQTLFDKIEHFCTVSSDDVQRLIAELHINFIDHDQAHAGDIVLYCDNDKLMHAGILGDDGRITSKWGGNDVHSHLVWDVPCIYGNKVVYVTRPEPSVVLGMLLQWHDA